MAERGRPKTPLVLTEEERQTLQRWARRAKSSQALALRCKIVLACAEGKTNQAVAEQLGIWPQTVTKWRGRFVRQRLEGLADEPRPGRPRTITDTQVEQVLTKTLEEPPPNHDTHWSTRSMAKVTGLSQTAISRIWRAFGLKPHLVQTWKLSTDPQFIDKVRDIVGLYLDPPEAALVLCMDEKSQIQALDRTAPSLPILPTTPARRSHDYVRNGTTSLFAALDVASGKGHLGNPPPPPPPGVPQVPAHYRQRRARRARRALDLRQLRNPQDAGDQAVVGAPSALSPAPDPDLQLVAEPGGAVVRRADHPQAAPLGASQRYRPGSRPSGLD
jgi:transposase